MEDQDTHQLIGADALAMIGQVLFASSGIVVKRDFQRWAASVGDLNPLYFDDDFARAQGYRSVIMPPMYLSHVTSTVMPLHQLRDDGISRLSGVGSIPLPRCPRRMAGGEGMSFHAPIYEGDELSSVRTLTSLQQKAGRTGPFVLVGFETVYTRSDGAVVATTDGSLVARPATA